MAEDMSDDEMRGRATTGYWGAECKDCAAERRLRTVSDNRKRRKVARTARSDSGFEYSGSWADRAFELGQTRSDRCELHRRAHREAIRALSVPYVDLHVIGQVRDRQNPTGPLGGLGPLPKPHVRKEAESDLQAFGFGMSDADVLRILEGLKEKRVAVIEAGTGTGKSTFMPFRLMNPPKGAAFRPTDDGQIVVTEPRRQAATGVASFVGEALVFGHDSRTCKLHTGPGFPVGYQVRGDRKWDMACDLVYVTDGTMINWVRDGSLARIGLVIVDEAHERNANIDIILAQLREKIKEYKHLRVIITSATIDCNFFIDYFGGETHVFHYSIPEKKSFGYGVPLFVGLEIDSSVIRNGLTLDTEAGSMNFQGWSGFGPEHPGSPPDDLARETEKYAALRCGREIPKERWVRQMPRALAEQVIAIADGTEFGDILGFLPTSATIGEAIAHITKALKRRDLDFDVYPLLSSTAPAITHAAVSARDRGEKRKIVISSNLAETSLTVSGVRYVVDSGLICQSQWNVDIASGSLPKVPHSQSGLRQRWGRVGRDAPGWVFPLYTAEQFLSLARDTPPEATRTNLEEFCTRLISTGLATDTAVLPGNFESSGYRPDQYAQDAAETFTKELRRAGQVIRAGGLVDADGDLTDLGREIERYSGTASEALAIALGDRLACLHEVALGIIVVARGNLYGGRNRILGTDFDWPPEWRLRADACHRALSAGCEDDLELALRIISLYEAADDGGHWCRAWWVNQNVLDNALAEVASIISNLSAAMKNNVTRPFRPDLLPRARAALTHAFKNQAYRKSENGTFTSVADEGSAKGPARALVPAQALVLAFSRIETTNELERSERRISHFVKVEERLFDRSRPNGEATPDDFDVLLRLTDGRTDRLDARAAERDYLGYVRTMLPIGCVARLDFSDDPDGSTCITDVKKLREPFLQPKSATSRSAGDDDSGYDPDWEYQPNDDAVPDDEEAASLPIDPRSQEVNDKVEGDYEPLSEPVRSVSDPETPRLSARTLFYAEQPTPNKAYLVSDYEIEDEQVVVLVEPFNESQMSMDPARHELMTCFDEVEIEFLDVVEDANWYFLRFRAADTQERFDVVADKFFALDRYATAMARDLQSGMTMKASIIAPKVGQRTISVRPYLRAALEKAGRTQPARPGQVVRFHDAAIATRANDYGNLDVQLKEGLGPAGVTIGVQVPAAWIGDERGIPSDIGSRLQVGLVTSPTDEVALRPLTDRLEALSKRSGGHLAIKGKKSVAMKPLDLALARQLAELEIDQDAEQWLVAVSNLFEASQLIEIKLALPAVDDSKKLRDDLMGEMKGIGWSTFDSTEAFFDPGIVEDIKSMGRGLRDVGQKLGENKRFMIDEHKSEVFERISEKRAQLDRFWDRRRELQGQRQQAWRNKVNSNLERNREKLARARAAAERTRDRIRENENKRSEATSAKWVAIFGEWIDRDLEKLSDIQSDITRISGWISEDEDRLAR